MKIVRNLDNIKKELQNSSLTIGNFDGLHEGHKEILRFNKNLAKKSKTKSALLTFEPHPRHFFNPKLDKDVRLYSLAQKLDILKKEKLVDIVFLIRFNQKLVDLNALEFIQQILVDKIKVKNLTVGYDFSFGKNRSGSSELLESLANKFNYNFYKIEASKDKNHNIISSTLARELLKKGDIEKTSKILGRNYEVKGIVVKGQSNGEKIGFKTANILPKSCMIKPKFGVYRSKTRIGRKTYDSITNFGIKPTFLEKNPIFETHIFNFNQNIYNKSIKIELLDFIREEKKFNSIEELKTQIKSDCNICKNTKSTIFSIKFLKNLLQSKSKITNNSAKI